jgi:hypothetical protein
MSLDEEQRLAQLLKRAVPEPPFALQPERVTARRRGHTSAKSWALPVLSAAAVLVIGVTIGAVTTHDPGQPARSAGSATSPTASASAAPRATATVPNLVGMTTATATRTVVRSGFIVRTIQVSSPTVPPGLVVAPAPAAGVKVAAGTTITLRVATS